MLAMSMRMAEKPAAPIFPALPRAVTWLPRLTRAASASAGGACPEPAEASPSPAGRSGGSRYLQRNRLPRPRLTLSPLPPSGEMRPAALDISLLGTALSTHTACGGAATPGSLGRFQRGDTAHRL